MCKLHWKPFQWVSRIALKVQKFDEKISKLQKWNYDSELQSLVVLNDFIVCGLCSYFTVFLCIILCMFQFNFDVIWHINAHSRGDKGCRRLGRANNWHWLMSVMCQTWWSWQCTSARTAETGQPATSGNISPQSFQSNLFSLLQVLDCSVYSSPKASAIL